MPYLDAQDLCSIHPVFPLAQLLEAAPNQFVAHESKKGPAANLQSRHLVITAYTTMVCLPVSRHASAQDRGGLGAWRLHGRSADGSQAKFGILVIALVLGLVILFIWLYIKQWGKGKQTCRRPVPRRPRGAPHCPPRFPHRPPGVPRCPPGGWKSKGKRKSKGRRKGNGDDKTDDDDDGKGQNKCNRSDNGGDCHGDGNGNDDRNSPQPAAPHRIETVYRIINADTANPELVPERIENIPEMPRRTYCRWESHPNDMRPASE